MKNLTRVLSLLAVVAFFATQATAQNSDKSKRPSPAVTATATVDGAKVTINYSSPAVKGRSIYGDLVPYGKVWRTGANEATVFEVDTDVMINGKKLPKGKYALFTIPGADTWTIIFNEEYDQWGNYNYSEAKDALRVMAKPTKASEFSERFTIDAKDDGEIHIIWADTAVPFTVSTK